MAAWTSATSWRLSSFQSNFPQKTSNGTLTLNANVYNSKLVFSKNKIRMFYWQEEKFQTFRSKVVGENRFCSNFISLFDGFRKISNVASVTVEKEFLKMIFVVDTRCLKKSRSNQRLIQCRQPFKSRWWTLWAFFIGNWFSSLQRQRVFIEKFLWTSTAVSSSFLRTFTCPRIAFMAQ